MAAPAKVAESTAEKCDITILRLGTGALQTLTLRGGGVIRIGRGVANDIVLDINGVSVYHTEIYLKPRGPGDSGATTEQLLCVRDVSKNGTAVRPGPHAAQGAPVDGKLAPWEPLVKDALRVLEHGWQLLVPLQSRTGARQLPEDKRILAIYVGGKMPPMQIQVAATATNARRRRLAPGARGREAVGGKLHHEARAAWVQGQGAKPKEREAKEQSFWQSVQAAPTKPAGVEEEEQLEAEADGRKAKKEKKHKKKEGKDEDKDERKKAKKEKKAKKQKEPEEQEEEEAEGQDDADEKANKKDKRKKKKDKKDDESDQEAENVETASVAPTNVEPEEARRQREERQRLEQELEDELAQELTRKEAAKKREAARKDEDEGRRAAEAAAAAAAAKAESERKAASERRAADVKAATEAAASDKDEGEDDEVKSAWNRALLTEASSAPAAPAPAAPAPAQAAAALAAPAAPPAPADVKEVPAVLEVTGSGGAVGTFLRCGLQNGQALYRRLLDEQVPMFLFFWGGGADRSCAGWYVASAPDKPSDEYQEFWASEFGLPEGTGAGDSGCRLEAKGKLDGPVLAALAALPEATRAAVNSAFSAASAGSPLPLAEVLKIGVAEKAAETSAADALPPWKRRKAQREAEKAAEERALQETASQMADEATTEAAGEAPPQEEDEPMPQEAAGVPEEEAKEAEPAVVVMDEAAPIQPVEDDAYGGAASLAGATEGTRFQEAEKEVPEETEAADEKAAEAEAEVEEINTEPQENVIADSVASEKPASEAKAGEEATEPAEVVESAVPDDEDKESVISRCSQTSAPQKTVPGNDRGESMAPTMFGARPGSSAGGDETEAGGSQVVKRLGGLTAEALAKHTAALAKAQAEAYAATFATAKSRYAKSAAGKSIAGMSIAGKSIAGKSIAGKTIYARSVAGKSIAGSVCAASERTFRTHATNREMLVGPSLMRELMRSVSPISEPGVKLKRRRRRQPSEEGSASPGRAKKKKDKKSKRDGDGVVLKASKRIVMLHPRAPSPSHYAPASPTPYRPSRVVDPSATPYDRQPEPSAAPSHWRAADPSAPFDEAEQRGKDVEKKKKKKDKEGRGKRDVPEAKGRRSPTPRRRRRSP